MRASVLVKTSGRTAEEWKQGTTDRSFLFDLRVQCYVSTDDSLERR